MEENEFIPVNQDKTLLKEEQNKSSKKAKAKRASFLSKIDFTEIATVVGSFYLSVL